MSLPDLNKTFYEKTKSVSERTRKKLVTFERKKFEMADKQPDGASTSDTAKGSKKNPSKNEIESPPRSESECESEIDEKNSTEESEKETKEKKQKQKKDKKDKKKKKPKDDSDESSDDDDKQSYSNKAIGKMLAEMLKHIRRPYDDRSKVDAVRACKNSIIPFARTNIGNFVDSVKSVLRQVGDDPEDITEVLNYAKQRVVGSNRIENMPSYSSMEELEKDLFMEFKPQRDEATVYTAICGLIQGEKEDVASYAKRAEALKHELGYAIRADAAKKNLTKDYTLLRIESVEEVTTSKFYTGLKPGVLQITKKGATTLPAAIEDALGAEANFKMLGLVRVGGQERSQQSYNNKKGKSGESKPNYQNKTSNAKAEGLCFNCNKKGHMKKDCRSAPRESGNYQKGGQNSQGQKSSNQGYNQSQPGPSNQGQQPKNGQQGSTASTSTLEVYRNA